MISASTLATGAGTCRGCGAEIFYSTDASGAPLPVDREPCADGNMILEWLLLWARPASPEERLRKNAVLWRRHACPERGAP